MRHHVALPLVFAAVLFLLLSPFAETASDAAFKVLAPGLEIATFARSETDSAQATGASESRNSKRADVVVLRVDPAYYEFRLLARSNGDAPDNLSVGEWARRHNLVVALNAGMYNVDHLSHVGYMKVGGHINCRLINPYKSAAAFHPLADSLPLFHIYDLDRDSLGEIADAYTYVMQNLRLIKRPGENRWQPQEKRWRGLVLAEDEAGRALIVLTQSSWAMYELNEFLLSLPIGVVAAQHLEGGAEAQLFVRTADTLLAWVGGREVSFDESDNRWGGWPIPNVLGVVARERGK